MKLFFYSLDERASLSVTITLHAWAYEHIHMAHPHGILMPSFNTHHLYLACIMKWWEDFYSPSLDGTYIDVPYYQHMLSHLGPD